jgi:hypothetical protein
MTPFPLKGGRAGDGGERAAVSGYFTGGARLLREPSNFTAFTPTLDPSPFEGEGGFWS